MPESFALRDRAPYIAAFLLTLFLVLGSEFLGLFEAANWHTSDLFFRLRGGRQPPKQIIIAEIDEKTLGALGRWPISRGHYADLLGRLEFADVVGLDIVFAEPSEDDAKLAATMHRFGRVILAAYLEESGRIVRPAKTLSGPKIGHVHVETGADGIARTVYHRMVTEGESLKSFASEIHESLNPEADHFALEDTKACSPGILQSHPMRINYYGRSGTFRRISFIDILDGKLSPESFQGMIVLVGVTVHGVEAGFVTPL